MTAASRPSQNSRIASASHWPHRWAVVLVCATFPLIWVGGLVTSTDAGMAVPDWPSTWGHNLFLYPWETWFFGPWDLFVEHGHRLLGALVGLITICLLVSLVLGEPRRWVKWFGGAALGLVILQGFVGGMRVRLDERLLAMLHGCLGPLFFGVVVALSVVTSRRWLDPSPWKTHPPRSNSPDAKGAGWMPLHRVALLTTVLSYLQLVLGAQLRHVPVLASPGFFRVLVWAHLLMAAVVTGHVILVAVHMRRVIVDAKERGIDAAPGALGHATTMLVALVVTQLVLGVGSWVVKYSWPAWMASVPLVGSYTITANGWIQALFPTAHAAIGSSLFAVSLMILLRSVRLLRPAFLAVSSGFLVTELAA